MSIFPASSVARITGPSAFLLAVFISACFTGDGLGDQPCSRDEDCNAIADVLGRTLTCRELICDYQGDCGDGIVDPSTEECDLGADNVTRAYGLGPGECSAADCRRLGYCGDEIVDIPNESCDDATDDDSGACPRCQSWRCGDGFVGPGEACDWSVDDNCTEDCARPTCGDGKIQGDEQCDDGNEIDSDNCVACLIAACGDGFVRDGLEECDDGNESNDDTCVAGCKLFKCGDGFKGPGEACDGDDECTDQCALPTCGDGVVQEGEECDDANEDDTDGCLSTCLFASCGDNFVGPGEECDDGNQVDSDACRVTCKEAECGDGVVYVGVEECDDMNNNYSDDCPNQCVKAFCGDGFVNDGVEDCDDGNTDDNDSCPSNCKYSECGNGITEGDEECDDGNNDDTDDCTNTCTIAFCGDNVIRNTEQCDDGNEVNTDDCVNCVDAYCGDGAIWLGSEECDDGGNGNTDGCIDTCKTATCGDGYTYLSVEECDDGEDNADNNSCKQDCTVNVCGDGLQGPNEECDDGNQSELDSCLTDCTKSVCGDGYVDASSEGCDDQNNDNNDGCSNTCEQGATAIGSGPASWHVCTIRAGKARCWGWADYGQLWRGSTATLGDEPNELPGANEDVPLNEEDEVVQIATGSFHTCALLKSGVVQCWGAGGSSQLGNGYGSNYGDEPDEPPPIPVDMGAGEAAKAIDAGQFHTCALLASGAVRCWGAADSAVLGQPGKPTNWTPSKLGDIDLGPNKTIRLATGALHTCALQEGGEVYCWGTNEYGQLGLGHTNSIGDDETPGAKGLVDVGGVVSDIAAGYSHTCALLEGGKLRCWGWGGSGQLGYMNTASIGTTQSTIPSKVGDVKMVKEGETVIKVAAGGSHTCVLLDSGSLRCWGFGGDGRLGYESTMSYGGTPEIPGFVNVDLVFKIRDLALGRLSTCVLLDGGHIRCWGTNDDGQLGINSTADVGAVPGDMPPQNSPIYSNP